MYEHSDCILCSIGGAGGATTDGEAVVGTARGGWVLPRALGRGGVNVGGTAGVLILTGMPNAPGNEGAATPGGSLGFAKLKKPAGGGEKTDGVGV